MQAFLALFCFIFAVNSAVHSYLVLRYSDGNKVAVNVGFYYMSNAAGRLTGTVLSGVLYSYAGATRADGFGWCFMLSAAFGVLCTAITAFIRDNEAGLACGRCVCVRGTDTDDGAAAADGKEAVPVGAEDAPVELEMRRSGSGSRGGGGGDAGGRGEMRWGPDSRVDEVRQRDSGAFAADDRPAHREVSREWGRGDGGGDEEWGRFGRGGTLSYPGAGPSVRLRCYPRFAAALLHVHAP